MKRWIGMLGLLLAACQGSAPPRPLALVPHVDLARYMGDWFVIANIPTFIEEGAHNAKESYRLDAEGRIETTFTFRQDSFEGELKTLRPRGRVLDRRSNAVWGMQFVWPIEADYRIAYLDEAYSVTVVGREKRDHVWIMARRSEITEAQYAQLVAFVAAQGYDVDRLRRVPQRWAP